jgi:hypothetical protein
MARHILLLIGLHMDEPITQHLAQLLGLHIDDP